MLYKEETTLKRTKLYSNPEVQGVYWKNDENNIEGYSTEGLILNLDANSFSIADDVANASNYISPTVTPPVLYGGSTAFETFNDGSTRIDTGVPTWVIPRTVTDIRFDLQKENPETTIYVNWQIGEPYQNWRGILGFKASSFRLEGSENGYILWSDVGDFTGNNAWVQDWNIPLRLVIRITKVADGTGFKFTVDEKILGRVADGTANNLPSTSNRALTFNRKSDAASNSGLGDIYFKCLMVWDRPLSDAEVATVLGN